MPILEKYQSLPGLDTWSPDVFETPDWEESVAGVEIRDTPSLSETINDAIDYSNISADVARERFLNKSLNSTGPVEDCVIESTEMKIVRLKKEIEELAATLQDSNVEHTEKGEDGYGSEFNEVSELANTMRAIVVSRQETTGALDVVRFLGSRSKFIAARDDPATHHVDLPSTLGVTQSTSNDSQSASLLNLDDRLSRLEKALGNTSSIAFSGAFHATVFEQPVIPTLLSLSQKVNSLTASPEKLDAILTRVRQLVAATEQASPPNATKPPTSSQKLAGETEDTTQADKIESIYSSLSSVEKLIQIVPGLVDRLRSLQFLHAEAGETISNISEIRDKMNATEAHISKWRTALENAERRLDEIEGREKRNLITAEEWVKDLESKVKFL
ncbi:Dynamitin-domain-containing protein [Lipomyces doorenjongii]|uniref:Dynamitin-domain-containing protein n=1 Tax=Lipomyces doorenjongii TaxID=383834 RepID=UPI0034CF1378